MNAKELAEYIAAHEPVKVDTSIRLYENPSRVYFENANGMTARQQRRRKQRKKRKVKYGL